MKRFHTLLLAGASLWLLMLGAPICAQQPIAPVVEPLKPLHQLRQAGTVQSLAVAPDGKTLAVAMRDEQAVATIALWNLENGQLLRSWNASAEQLAFAPDSKTLATAQQAEIVLWNLAGAKQKTLAGPAKGADSLKFSPNGKILVIGGSRKIGFGELWVYDLAANKNTLVPLPDANGIDALAFSPDSTLFAAPKSTGRFEQLPEIGIWEVASLRLISTLRDESVKGWINGLTFSPDREKVVSAHNGHQIVAWDAKTGTIQSTLLAYEPTNGPPNSARNVVFASDGRTLLVTANKWNDMGEGGEFLMWDWAKGELKRSLLPVESSVLRYFSVATGSPIVAGAPAFSSTVSVWRLP